MQFQGFDWLSGHGIYHAREKATIKLSSGCSCKAKSERPSKYFLIVFNKTKISLALVELDMR